uniref:Uncharacterized protein MANES_11G131400 n=1 Tax=Rhizophora mucronata TaxID=61149 RepID=A0A2P2ISZ7_RHIMU
MLVLQSNQIRCSPALDKKNG